MLRNIEAERVRNGFSKEQVSKKLGVSTRTYYNWINEETDIPSTSLLKMGLRNRQIMMRPDIKLPQPFASWSNSL